MTTPRIDLGIRTSAFGDTVREFLRKLPQTFMTKEDTKQLLRSSGSVGANYIEANEAFTKKDCAHKLKICRKEAKESEFWLQLLTRSTPVALEQERKALQTEAHELMPIFTTIIRKYYSP